MNSKTIKHIISHLMDEDDEDKDVVKTFKARPEWTKKFKMLEEMAVQEAELASKRKSIRDGLWGQIHEELDIFGGHLRFNDETSEIEQLEERD